MATSYTPSFQALISHANQTGDWVVLVTPPNSPCAQGFRTYGLGLLPHGTEFTGRTAMFADGGRLSLVESGHPFEAKGDLSVMFLGFEDVKASAKQDLVLAGWRKRAKNTITLGSKPGELNFH
jgi:hypothetical protein